MSNSSFAWQHCAPRHCAVKAFLRRARTSGISAWHCLRRLPPTSWSPRSLELVVPFLLLSYFLLLFLYRVLVLLVLIPLILLREHLE